MATAIDQSLLQDHKPWSQRTYAVFDEMRSNGNLVAEMVKTELKQLDRLLKKLSVKDNASDMLLPTTTRNAGGVPLDGINTASTTHGEELRQSFDAEVLDSFGLGLNYDLSAEQLMEMANALDAESLNWPIPQSEIAAYERRDERGANIAPESLQLSIQQSER